MRQDREFYRDLAARYLEADTTAEEEKALAEYLARYAESAEDKALARLLMLEHHGYLHVSGPCADMEEDACVPLSDEAEKEFDPLLHTGSGSDPEPETPFASGKGHLDALRLAGNMQSLMDIADGHIASVSAVPSGDAALVTARFTDETSRLYIMTYNGDEGSASLVALNE